MQVHPSRSVGPILLAAALSVVAGPVGAQSPTGSPAPGSSAEPAASVAPVLVCPAAGTADAPVASGSFAPVEVAAAPEDAPIGEWTGTWTRIADAPIAPRSHAAADVTLHGERLLVFSGRDGDGRLLWDGATYDALTDRWVKLPKVPLMPRTGFAFETGGDGSMFLWGGVAEDGTPMGDGAYVWAARDVARGDPRVQVVPEAPLTAGPASAAGDLYNEVYVVTRGEAPADPPRFAYLAGPHQGWRGPTIPPWPERLPNDEPSVPAGIGYEVTSDGAIVSYQADGTALISTFSGRDGWGAPVVLPLSAIGGTCPTNDRDGLAWVRELPAGPVGLLAWDWRFLARPPVAASVAGMLVWSPARLILADALVAWDPLEGRWLQLPPLPGEPRTGVSAMWAYGSLVIWGGRTADGRLPKAGWRFTPDLPANTFALPRNIGRHTGDCGGTGIDDRIRLRADRADKDLVWFAGREGRYTVSWPDGWTVRFAGPRAVVLDEHGAVVAREGQRLRDIEREPFCTSNMSISF